MRPGPLPMPEAPGNKAFSCRSFEGRIVVNNPLIRPYFLEGKHGIGGGGSRRKADSLSLTASLHLKIGRNQNP